MRRLLAALLGLHAVVAIFILVIIEQRRELQAMQKELEWLSRRVSAMPLTAEPQADWEEQLPPTPAEAVHKPLWRRSFVDVKPYAIVDRRSGCMTVSLTLIDVALDMADESCDGLSCPKCLILTSSRIAKLTILNCSSMTRSDSGEVGTWVAGMALYVTEFRIVNTGPAAVCVSAGGLTRCIASGMGMMGFCRSDGSDLIEVVAFLPVSNTTSPAGAGAVGPMPAPLPLRTTTTIANPYALTVADSQTFISQCTSCISQASAKWCGTYPSAHNPSCSLSGNCTNYICHGEMTECTEFPPSSSGNCSAFYSEFYHLEDCADVMHFACWFY